VYVGSDKQPMKTTLDRIVWLHLACEPNSARPENLSNVIPVGGREP